MRSFKGSQNFVPSATQPQIYSPSRTNYQNKVINVTQSSKNKNRAQQIVSLHEQFEDLKKKIKQVQNKNERIIQKIHKECNFKKKSPQTFQILADNTAPIIYYQKKEKSQISQMSGVSVDQSNKSDQSQYEFRQKKNVGQRNSVQSNKYISSNMFSQSMQYTKPQPRIDMQKKYSKISNKNFDDHSIHSQEMIEDRFEEETQALNFQMQGSHQTYHHLKDFNKGENISKNSGKKSHIIPSYPSSQTHMGYSLFNQNAPSQQQINIRNSSLHQSSLNISIYQLQQSLKIEKQKNAYLEQQLKNKQIEILNIKKDFNKIVSQFDNLQMILQDQLDSFMENVIKKGFFDIEKTMKKNQNRIRNLSIKLKDQYEEHKSSKLIKEHQLRRSNSKSRRDLSPGHNTSIHSVVSPLTQGPAVKIPRPGSSSLQGSLLQVQSSIIPDKRESKSKISEQAKKNKEFEEIVSKYQEMIYSKNNEISKLQSVITNLTKKNDQLEVKVDLKEKQLKEIKIKMQQLQKLMSQTYHQVPITKNIRNLTKQKYAQRRISSNQSNLLEDIYQQDTQKEHKQTQFELKYLQIKQQLQDKIEKIFQLQQKIFLLEKQLSAQRIDKKSQSNQSNSSSSTTMEKIAKQKMEDEIKNSLKQKHSIELNDKDLSIKQLKQKILGLQKKIVEKDCEIISLENKIKKNEGINEINFKKISQFQKLLNHYQHNNSIDLQNNSAVFLLDKSICNQNDHLTSRSTTGIQFSNGKEKSSKKNVIISRNQLQTLEIQIQNLNQQILSLTKKLKLQQKQKITQIQHLYDQIQNLKGQKQKIVKQNNQLKKLVQQLQEKKKQCLEHDQNQQDQYQIGEFLDQKIEHNNSVHSMNSKSQTTSRVKKIKNLRKKTADSIALLQLQRYELETRNINAEQEDRKKRLQEQLQLLKQKNFELSKQVNHLKTEHLQLSRCNISLKKDNEYLHESLSDRELKYERYKKETEELKIKLNEAIELCHLKDQQLKKEKQETCQKIKELQKQWHQFQEEINLNNNPDNLHSSFADPHKNLQNSELMRSSRYNISQSSLLLSSTIHNKNNQYLQQQNDYLTVKLKQAQATIQMHNIMQQKVLNQYKSNVQKIKNQMKQKSKQCQSFKKQLQILKDAKRRLEIMYESSKNQLAESRLQNHSSNRKRQISEISNKKSQKEMTIQKGIIEQQNDEKQFQMQEFASYTQQNNLSMISGEANLIQIQNEEGEKLNPYEKVLQLQNELKQSKDINKKLQEMSEQLFKQIRLKEEQKNDLMKILDQKSLKIQELEEIVQLKQMNINSSHLGSNILGSHISSSNHKSSSQNKNSQNNLSQRQSMHSHSSLRYSGITHSRHPVTNPSSNHLNIMGQSHLNTSQRFQIQLSQTGSQMLDQSYVTNISQIFEKEEFPYQKVQLKRKQQIRLFQKTAQYIKSLKQSINQKNKKIKLLQKKIQSLKNNHHAAISKELQNKYEISTSANDKQDLIQIEFQTVFKDYQSVQLQRKKASHSKRFKSLEHQWKLAIQENNVLVNQIEAFQQQLQKAEQQQNNLLKIKDLYKEEIKKLITKNEIQSSYYEDLLSKQKKKVQQSQSIHNIETLKQLFVKVIDAIIVMQSEKTKKKREDKRKEIEEYFKVFASLSAIDQTKKTALIQGIRKMTLNIVLAQEGRSSSASKKT